jgi:hypothetical protein
MRHIPTLKGTPMTFKPSTVALIALGSVIASNLLTIALRKAMVATYGDVYTEIEGLVWNPPKVH